MSEASGGGAALVRVDSLSKVGLGTNGRGPTDGR